MNSIERFFKTVAREEVDRPACWLGIPDKATLPQLYKYYGVHDYVGLKVVVNDNHYPVELPYHSPYSDAIYNAFDFSKEGEMSTDERTLTKPGVFEDAKDPEEVNNFEWPQPETYISAEECARVLTEVPEGKVALGILWSSHFQDTCTAFGMEAALMNMIANPEMYIAVDDKIIYFYLRANEIFYENTKGRLHAVLIGNDMGSQRGLMLSPDMIRKFVLPGAIKLVEQAHSYGLKVIYHSCGAVSEIFDDLLAIGVDAQNLLVNGTPKMVADRLGS